MKKQQVLIITSRLPYSCLCYSACKSHLFCVALHCCLWPVWLSHILTHYLTKGTVFRKTLLNIQRLFCSPYNFCLKH